MKLLSTIRIAALAASLLGTTAAPLFAAAPATPTALSPCALSAADVQAAFGLTVDRTEVSDMTLPGGRDVGCLYTFKDSSFELTVRQTWDDSRPAGAASLADGERGTAIPNDPDGAFGKAAPADRPGARAELAYARGKVQTRISVHGGRLLATEALAKLVLLRRVP